MRAHSFMLWLVITAALYWWGTPREGMQPTHTLDQTATRQHDRAQTVAEACSRAIRGR